MSLREDMLLCKYVKSRATADELYGMMGIYHSQHGLKWENCVGFCSDGAHIMSEKRKGLWALIKRVAPDAQRTHCVIHREALASRQLSPELNEILTDVVSIMNFIKTRPLKARLFTAVCQETGAEQLSSCCSTENKVQIPAQHWAWLESGGFKPATPFWNVVQCKTGSLQPLMQ